MANERRPFVDLPAGLVEEVLEQTSAVGDVMLASFRELKAGRQIRREELVKSGSSSERIFARISALAHNVRCGWLLRSRAASSTDLAAAAAVAVEGLTPPSEKRFWEEPRHSTYIVAEMHCADTATVLRAVMLGRELLLAAKAPHDLVMLDMTFTLPIIYFNQAINQAPASPELKCSTEFLNHCCDYLEAYRDLLKAERSDKNYIALPKYSTRREARRGNELARPPGRPQLPDPPPRTWGVHEAR